MKDNEDSFWDWGYLPLGILALIVYITAAPIMRQLGRDQADWEFIPVSDTQRKIAVRAQEQTESFQALRAEAVQSIKNSANHGGREVEIYVGRYDKEAIKELDRRLHFRGYKVEYTQLSVLNEFMVISW
jgi:hypothetical protein